MLKEDIKTKALKQALENRPYSKYFVLCDSNTKKNCLPLLKPIFEALKLEFVELTIPAGEEKKNIESCLALWNELSLAKADRNALLINLGGGMICDIGGFVAATYKRGISFINLPTSLLAMVDASIGGKCGIDFQYYKNQIGVFKAAEEIYSFPVFLKTLPIEELKSGFAEIIKHALIVDPQYFETIQKLESITEESCSALIDRSQQIKTAIVELDPFESGERKKLNFGHTIGHAIESYFLEQKRAIPHGFAIAAGMICETYLSVKILSLSRESQQLIEQLIYKLYSKLEFDKAEIKHIVEKISQDKKSEKGTPKFVLLSSVGKAVIDQNVSNELIQESLEYYCN